MGGEGDPYLLAVQYSFDSRDRLEAYLNALRQVMHRHDILRTAVVWEGLAEPVQVVRRKVELPVKEIVLDPAAGDVAGQLYARFNPRRYRIDVRQAPLLEVGIAEDSANQRWLMVLLLHHLAGDHNTLEVMQEEIYAYLQGQTDRLPLPMPFRNLVAQARLGVSKQEHEAFFRRMLADVDEPTAPFGLLEVLGDGTGIEEARIGLDLDLSQRLRARARRLGVSTASICHVAWAQVLAQISGRTDVVFGTVLIGRMQGGAGADRVMGLFINTLPLRIQVGPEGVEDTVRHTHALLAELLRHEHASLSLAQRCSGVPAPTPLFSSLLNYRHIKQGSSAQNGNTWPGIQVLLGETRSNYPLTLSVNDFGDSLALAAQAEVTTEPLRVCLYMRTALESLLNALERAPSTELREIDVLSDHERRQMLFAWNLKATSAALP